MEFNFLPYERHKKKRNVYISVTGMVKCFWVCCNWLLVYCKKVHNRIYINALVLFELSNVNGNNFETSENSHFFVIFAIDFFASSNSIFVFHLLLSSTMFLQLQSLELCRINVFTTNTPTTFCRLRFRKKRLSFVLHFDNCDNVKCVWNIWRRNHFEDIAMIIVATCVCEYELQTP